VLKFWSWPSLVNGALIRNALNLDLSWPRSTSRPATSLHKDTELRKDDLDTRASQGSQETLDAGMFGEGVKHIIGRELHTGAISLGNIRRSGYPTYPKGYPYPPFVKPEPILETQTPGVHPSLVGQHLSVLPYPKSPSASTTNGTLPMLALHLRRGDFSEHCNNLAEWGSTFMGFSTLGGSKVPYVGGGRVESDSPQAGGVDGFVVPTVVGVGFSDEDDVESEAGDDEDERRAKLFVTINGGTAPNKPTINSTLEFEGRSNVEVERNHVVNTDEERRDIYMRRCFPTIEEIGERVGEVVKDWAVWQFVKFVEDYEREAYRHMDDANYQIAFNDFQKSLETRISSVYLMTNGDEEWASNVGREVGRVMGRLDVKVKVDVRIEGNGGVQSRTTTRSFAWSNPNWRTSVMLGRDGSAKWVEQQDDLEDEEATNEKFLTISSSRNLLLTSEEKYAGQAVDMYIAQRAEMFIGNGVGLFLTLYSALH